MSEPIWKNEDGREIPVSEMTPRHLLNAYKWLGRKRVQIAEMAMFYLDSFWGPQGEHAQDAADAAMDEAWEEEARYDQWLPILAAEIGRRGLQVPALPKPQPPPDVEIVGYHEGGVIARIITDKGGG